MTADANKQQCYCFEKMGNDFFFLPSDKCIAPKERECEDHKAKAREEEKKNGPQAD